MRYKMGVEVVTVMGSRRRRGCNWNKVPLSFRNRAIFWIFVGILLVQGTLGQPSNATTNSTETESADSSSESGEEGVEVVSLVKKDKRQAQRGYTDVPLDRGPFDELIASSPSPIAFENDLPTFVDSLSDIADATGADYQANRNFNSSQFVGFTPAGSKSSSYGNNGGGGKSEYVGFTPAGPSPTPFSLNNVNSPVSPTISTDKASAEITSLSSARPSLEGPSPSPSSHHQTVVIASNKLGPLINISKPAGFHNTQFSVALNNGVPFGPVSSGSGLTGPGITPTGPLTDSLALPDNHAAAAINLERRQVELPPGININEPPPFNGKAIPGEPGIDYPVYDTVPRTQFSCKDQQYGPGYYADTQARCQVFWICQKHRMDGFLCPNGTLFNQQVFVCDWWFNVDCSAAPQYYSRNQFVYAGPGVGIDGSRVRGLSIPLSASNRVSNVLPPQPAALRNNALLAPPPPGTQVQSSNQVSRVAPVTAIPPIPSDVQSRADYLNNYLKQLAANGGPSYQSQLVSRLQGNPNKLHDLPFSNTKPSSAPAIPSILNKEYYEKRVPSASSQISQAQITSGTSRPTIVSSYEPQHVETVSIVTTPGPTTRRTTPRPPPPPIPKLHISPTAKPIKGPSPTPHSISPFGNIIKLGTTVTISTSPRPDYSTKNSLFKGIISSTIKPSKSGILKLSNTNLLSSLSQNKPVLTHHQPTTPHPYHSRQPTTEDPTNTVRPADYTPSRAPDPTPPGTFSGPGYLPNGQNNYHDSSNFGRDRHSNNNHHNQQYFPSSTRRPYTTLAALGMRSNQFSNPNGQRESSYAATSRKDTFVEFPYSPSQQKNKQKLQEIAASKDISSSKAVVTVIPHFYGQRSNVYSGGDSFSYVAKDNRKILIDHTNYSQKQSPFRSTTPQTPILKHNPRFQQQPQFSGPPPPQHHHSAAASQQHLHSLQHTTPRPTPPAHSPQQGRYIDTPGPSPSHPTPSLAPAPQHQLIHQQNPHSLPVTPKPEQRFIVTTLAPSPPPHHQQQQQYHQSSPAPFHHPSTQVPYNQHSASHPPRNFQLPPQQSQQQYNQQPPPPPPQYTNHDAVTVRDGFAALNAGSYVSIQTTAAPFHQQILKHNSLQPYQDAPPRHQNNGNSGVIGYSSTGPPPTPQQVIFSDPPTTSNNLGPLATSTASSRAFDHRGPPPQQNNFISSTSRPHYHQSSSSTPQPYYSNQVSSPAPTQQHHNLQQHHQQYHQQVSSTPYSTPNNFVAAPTQSPFHTTSPGHRTNTYLSHNHGKQKSKHHRQQQQQLSASNPSQFPNSGITTTIKYPEGTGKLRLDFSGANGGGGSSSNRKNIVDFTYSATPTPSSPTNYISSSSTPYPSNTDRFQHAVSSTTPRSSKHHSPSPSGRGRFAGSVINKSNLGSSPIYVDSAATAESVSTPVSVPLPSATTPTPAVLLSPVSTSNYGLRLSANAKKRMTGAWQSYFSSKSE